MKNMILVLIATAMFTQPATASEPVEVSDPYALTGRPLQQIALTTRDLEKAKKFYSKTLGLPFLFETNGMAFFDLAGTRLMIALDPDRPDTKPTSIHYFDTPNLGETISRLSSFGVKLDGPLETVQSTPQADLKLQQFSDPDGNALAVMAWVPKIK